MGRKANQQRIRERSFFTLYYSFVFFIIYYISLANTVHAEESWSFNVLADWHGAEVFATQPSKETLAWKGSYDVLQYIKKTYRGDLILIPGDSNSGLWNTEKFSKKFEPQLSLKERVHLAGINCYGTMKKLFTEAGYGKVLMAIGDHELGDNGWWKGESKVEALPAFIEGFIDGFNNDSEGNFLYQDQIGSVTSTPFKTQFRYTSYAHQHKNVLFITINAFTQWDQNYIDRSKGRGGEGVIRCTVTGKHLEWFENVLQEARKDMSIKHIIVQSHIPIIQPVRKVSTSGQFMDNGEDSLFWKKMVQYKVDIYFAGEVHTNTATKARDRKSNLLQVVTRGNSFNNLLTVEVRDSHLNLTSYNEVGTEIRWNKDYVVQGRLEIDKSQRKTKIISSGVLELLDIEPPIVKIDFADIVPLENRQILGMKDSTNGNLIPKKVIIRGIASTQSLPNKGSFGQQYDAQVANVDLVYDGRSDKFAGSFDKNSRLAVYSTGPHNGGFIISYALWVNTKSELEMILIHYGNRKKGRDIPMKDIYTLTLQNGTPILYTAVDDMLIPKDNYNLNDGQWHHIAVSMPTRSCKLSKVVMYVDGKVINTAAPENDRHIFFSSVGNVNIGGFGYSHVKYETIFPMWSHFVGRMDDFRMWARALNYDDVSAIIGAANDYLNENTVKTRFITFQGKFCQKTGRTDKKDMNSFFCEKECRERPDCWGIQTWESESRVSNCLLYYDVAPEIGGNWTKSTCKIKQQTTREPSQTPSSSPELSKSPSVSPSSEPTAEPSSVPTAEPSSVPTAEPSSVPTAEPSSVPSTLPSMKPSSRFSSVPSQKHSNEHSENPSYSPISEPTAEPSKVSSPFPSLKPSSRSIPSQKSSDEPKKNPSLR